MSDINQYNGAFLQGAQVQTDDIADDSVTAAKLGDDVSSLTSVDDVTIALTNDELHVKDGGVDTTQLADAGVTLGKLASAVAPSHVAKFGGTFTTVGGDASEAITVTGAAATDIVAVTVKTAGVTPRSIVAATAATNAINVTMSGDPSNDHVLQYVVFRATS